MTGAPWSSQDTQHCWFITTWNVRLRWVELSQIILRFKFSCQCNSAMYEDPETDTEMLIHWGSPETDCHWSLDDGSRPMTAACADSEVGHGTTVCIIGSVAHGEPTQSTMCLLWLFCTQSTSVYWCSAASFLHLWFEMSKKGLTFNNLLL